MAELEPIQLGWFLSGIIVGIFFNPATAIFLTMLYIVAVNKPLPAMLGNATPQLILFNILYEIYNLKQRIISHKPLPKEVNKEEPRDIPLLTQQGQQGQQSILSGQQSTLQYTMPGQQGIQVPQGIPQVIQGIPQNKSQNTPIFPAFIHRTPTQMLNGQ